MKRTSIFSLAALVFLAVVAGCAHRSDRIIYSRTTKSAAETQGFMRIATEEPVPVTVDGHEDAYEARPLAGYLVIVEEDLVRLIGNTADLVALRRGARMKGVDLAELIAAGRRQDE